MICNLNKHLIISWYSTNSHFNDDCVIKVVGKQLDIDSRGHENDLEVLALSDQTFQDPEQEICEHMPLMDLIDHHNIILTQIRITLNLTQEDTFGEKQNFGRFGPRFFESNLFKISTIIDNYQPLIDSNKRLIIDLLDKRLRF